MPALFFLAISAVVIPSTHHCFSFRSHRDVWVHSSTLRRARQGNGGRLGGDECIKRQASSQRSSGNECMDASEPKSLQDSQDELSLMGETLVAILANGVDSEKAVSKSMRRHRNDLLNSNERRAKFAAVILGTSVQRRRLSFLLDGWDSGADGRAQGGIIMTNKTADTKYDLSPVVALDAAAFHTRSSCSQMRAESLLLLFQLDTLLRNAEHADHARLEKGTETRLKETDNDYATQEGAATAAVAAVSSTARFASSPSTLPSTAPALPPLPWEWNPYPARRKVLMKRAKRGLEELHKQRQSGTTTITSDATEAAASEAASFCLGVDFSLPPWLATAWVAQYGLVSARLLALSSNSPGLVCLRRNRARCASLADLCANIKADLRFLQSATSVQSPFSSPSPHPKQAAELEELVSLVTSHAGAQYGWETGLVFSERPPTVLGLKSWQNGLFEVMDQGSQFIAAAVEASPGEVILDLCAGNGGKTLALASAMHTTIDNDASIAAPSNRILGGPCDGVHMNSFDGEINTGDTSSSTSTSSTSTSSRTVATTSIASSSVRGGRVICFDVSADRLKQLRGSLDRAGVTRDAASSHSSSSPATTSEDGVSVQICWPSSSSSLPSAADADADAADAAGAPASSSISAQGLDFQMLSDEDVPKNSVDAALVDAPCSSSGVLRRRPSLRWSMQHPNKSGLSKEGEQKEWGGNEDTAKMTEVENEKTSLSPAMGSLPTLQRALLLRAASAVKPGGRLVYATCSVFAAENEEVTAWFEEQEAFKSGCWEPWPFPDSKSSVGIQAPNNQEPVNISPQSHILDGYGEQQQLVSAKDGVNHVMPSHWRALLPHVHGTDGFFVARWRRR